MSYFQTIQQIKQPTMLNGCSGGCPAKCEKDGAIHLKMKKEMNSATFNKSDFLDEQDKKHGCSAADHCGSGWKEGAMSWN